MKAPSKCRGVALLFPNLGARWGWMVNAIPLPLYPLTWEESCYSLEEAGWAPLLVWMVSGKEKIPCLHWRSNCRPSGS